MKRSVTEQKGRVTVVKFLPKPCRVFDGGSVSRSDENQRRWESNFQGGLVQKSGFSWSLHRPSSSNQSFVNNNGSGDKLFWKSAMDQMGQSWFKPSTKLASQLQLFFCSFLFPERETQFNFTLHESAQTLRSIYNNNKNKGWGGLKFHYFNSFKAALKHKVTWIYLQPDERISILITNMIKPNNTYNEGVGWIWNIWVCQSCSALFPYKRCFLLWYESNKAVQKRGRSEQIKVMWVTHFMLYITAE